MFLWHGMCLVSLSARFEPLVKLFAPGFQFLLALEQHLLFFFFFFSYNGHVCLFVYAHAFLTGAAAFCWLKFPSCFV